MDWKYLQDN